MRAARTYFHGSGLQQSMSIESSPGQTDDRFRRSLIELLPTSPSTDRVARYMGMDVEPLFSLMRPYWAGIVRIHVRHSHVMQHDYDHKGQTARNLFYLTSPCSFPCDHSVTNSGHLCTVYRAYHKASSQMQITCCLTTSSGTTIQRQYLPRVLCCFKHSLINCSCRLLVL